MTVSEFIAFLQTQPQDIQVAYQLYSEQAILKSIDIEVVELGVSRRDGWIHNRRVGGPTQKYLLLPGN